MQMYYIISELITSGGSKNVNILTTTASETTQNDIFSWKFDKFSKLNKH